MRAAFFSASPAAAAPNPASRTRGCGRLGPPQSPCSIPPKTAREVAPTFRRRTFFVAGEHPAHPAMHGRHRAAERVGQQARSARCTRTRSAYRPLRVRLALRCASHAVDLWAAEPKTRPCRRPEIMQAMKTFIVLVALSAAHAD